MRKQDYFLDADNPLVTINESLVPDTCLSKAADDEPIFILRGHDPEASKAIEMWMILSAGSIDLEKHQEAQKCADPSESNQREIANSRCARASSGVAPSPVQK